MHLRGIFHADFSVCEKYVCYEGEIRDKGYVTKLPGGEGEIPQTDKHHDIYIRVEPSNYFQYQAGYQILKLSCRISSNCKAREIVTFDYKIFPTLQTTF